MCVISNKIKFCTCKATSTERLKNYWRLHRYTKDRDEIVMGEPFYPDFLLNYDYETNKDVLKKRLNEEDAFDKEIKFLAKDVLEIVFQYSDSDRRDVYGFRYNNGKWCTHEVEDFYLMNHFDEVQFGKIKK